MSKRTQLMFHCHFFANSCSYFGINTAQKENCLPDPFLTCTDQSPGPNDTAWWHSEPLCLLFLLHTLLLLSGLLRGGLFYLGHPVRNSAPGKRSIWGQWLRCGFSFWSNSLFLMCHFDHCKHFQMLRLMCGTSSFSSVVRWSLRDVIKNKAGETI